MLHSLDTPFNLVKRNSLHRNTFRMNVNSKKRKIAIKAFIGLGEVKLHSTRLEIIDEFPKESSKLYSMILTSIVLFQWCYKEEIA